MVNCDICRGEAAYADAQKRHERALEARQAREMALTAEHAPHPIPAYRLAELGDVPARPQRPAYSDGQRLMHLEHRIDDLAQALALLRSQIGAGARV